MGKSERELFQVQINFSNEKKTTKSQNCYADWRKGACMSIGKICLPVLFILYDTILYSRNGSLCFYS